MLLGHLQDVLSYLDPFTGGYIFQMLFVVISGMLGVLLFIPRCAKRTLDVIIKKVKSLWILR